MILKLGKLQSGEEDREVRDSCQFKLLFHGMLCLAACISVIRQSNPGEQSSSGQRLSLIARLSTFVTSTMSVKAYSCILEDSFARSAYTECAG